MAKGKSTVAVELALTEREAQVLKGLLALVNWPTEDGKVAEDIWDALDDVGVEEAECRIEDDEVIVEAA